MKNNAKEISIIIGINFAPLRSFPALITTMVRDAKIDVMIKLIIVNVNKNSTDNAVVPDSMLETAEAFPLIAAPLKSSVAKEFILAAKTSAIKELIPKRIGAPIAAVKKINII